MEKKIKFGCVAWGLPGGGYFGPQICKGSWTGWNST